MPKDYVDLPDEAMETKGDVSADDIDKRKAKEDKAFKSGVVEESEITPFDVLSITLSLGKVAGKQASKALAKAQMDSLKAKAIEKVRQSKRFEGIMGQSREPFNNEVKVVMPKHPVEETKEISPNDFMREILENPEHRQLFMDYIKEKNLKK